MEGEYLTTPFGSLTGQVDCYLVLYMDLVARRLRRAGSIAGRVAALSSLGTTSGEKIDPTMQDKLCDS